MLWLRLRMAITLAVLVLVAVALGAGCGDDDFISEPDTFRSGATGSIVFKIDQPGVYDFRCDFHPTIMTGEITVE